MNLEQIKIQWEFLKYRIEKIDGFSGDTEYLLFAIRLNELFRLAEAGAALREAVSSIVIKCHCGGKPECAFHETQLEFFEQRDAALALFDSSTKEVS